MTDAVKLEPCPFDDDIRDLGQVRLDLLMIQKCGGGTETRGLAKDAGASLDAVLKRLQARRAGLEAVRREGELREALQFYADIDNPDDGGTRARAALSPNPQEGAAEGEGQGSRHREERKND